MPHSLLAEFGPEAPDASRLSLLPVRVEAWQGLVFCSLAGNPRPLSEELRDLEPLVAPHALHKMHSLKDWIEPIACNWKTYVDVSRSVCCVLCAECAELRCAVVCWAVVAV